MILHNLVKLLLRNQHNVNYSIEEALFQSGDVYLKIPEEGTGIVHIEIKGTNREFKAKSKDKLVIETGDQVIVVAVEGDVLVVEEK